MKIDIYTLLGLVKDGKAPKKIKYDGDVYVLESDGIFEFFAYKTIDYDKFNTNGKRIGKALFLDNCYMHLYSEVEIIEEDKKIEKLDVALLSQCDNWLRCPTNNVTKQDIGLNPYIIENIRENTLYFQRKINELIDEVNKLKEK